MGMPFISQSKSMAFLNLHTPQHGWTTCRRSLWMKTILDELVESLYVVPNTVSPKNRYCDENLLIMAIHNVKMIVMPPPDPLGSMRIKKTISKERFFFFLIF